MARQKSRWFLIVIARLLKRKGIPTFSKNVSKEYRSRLDSAAIVFRYVLPTKKKSNICSNNQLPSNIGASHNRRRHFENLRWL